MNANSLPTPSSSIRTRLLQRDETLFCQGDETFAIFVVRRGQVRLVRHLEDGSDVLLHTARVGNTFSEAALFSPAYHCDAIASADSEIEVHPKAALLAALEEDAAAAQSFMAHMARQIIALRSRLENRNIRSAEERVLHLLRLKMAGKERQVTFAEPLKDVAREAGLTHEAFYRALSRLQSQGRISRERRTITLLDAA